MARTSKYWECEKPSGGSDGIAIGDNIIKHYPGAGVIQVFNFVRSRSYTGLSKGVTLHLDKLNASQLEQLAALLVAMISAELDRHQRPSSVPPVPQVAADPDRFKALFGKLLAQRKAVPA